ncbi:hypothetical protein [Granulibacter bethesdensis]|uniref:hypothetical protein n=1 Tax=Granulibacter bethesdensis TaxID=364410 RepID=UPI0004B7E0EF|nr:hypothetical protein [Granulibacter bethesdensis]
MKPALLKSLIQTVLVIAALTIPGKRAFEFFHGLDADSADSFKFMAAIQQMI